GPSCHVSNDPPADDMLSGPESALLALGRTIRDRGYHFTTITPLSHRRVNMRTHIGPASLEDMFGWNRCFDERQVSEAVTNLLHKADALEVTENGLRSRVRFSTLGDQLFVHSAFPTDDSDAV